MVTVGIPVVVDFFLGERNEQAEKLYRSRVNVWSPSDLRIFFSAFVDGDLSAGAISVIVKRPAVYQVEANWTLNNGNFSALLLGMPEDILLRRLGFSGRFFAHCSLERNTLVFRWTQYE